MAKYFEAADIFLFASLAENFPCVILEAMSAKCCVVATPTSGVTEQIAHGKSGYLANEISGESLGEVLREALSQSVERSAYGNAARLRVEQEFSEAVMVDRYLSLYQETLKSAR